MRTTLLFACVGCVALVGCSRSDTNAPSTTTVTSAAVRTEAAPDPDPLLARRVEAALAADPKTSAAAANVEVTATEGVVTLRGAVADYADKAVLEGIARRVPGVVETLDKVDVSPSRAEDIGEIDERIAFSLQRAMMFDPSVSSDAARVTIDVSRGGNVTLRGTTARATTRATLQRIASETQGVTDVKNELVAEAP